MNDRPVSIWKARAEEIPDEEYDPAPRPGGECAVMPITAVSVLLNVLLVVGVFYYRQAQHWRNGISDERAVRPKFRRFVFRRTDDVSGVSGTGDVCEVAEFSDGHAALHWLGEHPLTTPHPNGLKEILAIHGHGGKGKLVPIDPS